MPDNCWYKLILTKNDYMPDVSTVEQPSSAAYEQLNIRISNYKLPEEWRSAFIYLESCLQVHQVMCNIYINIYIYVYIYIVCKRVSIIAVRCSFAIYLSAK